MFSMGFVLYKNDSRINYSVLATSRKLKPRENNSLYGIYSSNLTYPRAVVHTIDGICNQHSQAAQLAQW